MVNKMEDSSSYQMCNHLCRWLQSIVPNAVESRDVALELCDGVAMLEALLHIAPVHFHKLDGKIKRGSSDSWRVRVSNLKKITEAISEYYQDVLQLQLKDSALPDANKIGTASNTTELAKLLRLILGCAINCDHKQEYITRIMSMEETIQSHIMEAINQLEVSVSGSGNVAAGASGAHNSCLNSILLDTDSSKVTLTNYRYIVGELEAANEAKDNLSQQCQQLEMQIQTLIKEKQTLSRELQTLHEQEVKKLELRKHNELLQEELFKAEVIREDFKVKINEQHKQILANQDRIAELQLAASDTSRLKDEVDALAESAVKVQNLEIALTSYKKKLEHYGDMKKTLQKLEEKNVEYLEKMMKMEEELSKCTTYKSQCETYKKQLTQLEQKLDEEAQRADRAQFNYEQLENKLIANQSEKERLLHERDILKEENDELKLIERKTSGDDTMTAVSQELTPTELKERVRYLERENKLLRTTNNEQEATQTLLDNAQCRIEKLQQQNRQLNQAIVKLEMQLEEPSKLLPAISASASEDDINSSSLREYKQKITNLQEALTVKENDLRMQQARCARHLEKAREVAQQLDPDRTNGALVVDDASSISNNVNDNHNGNISNINQQHPAMCPAMSENEEQLVVGAFYCLGMNCHREAIEERLVLNTGQGQSFLARQRQPTPRKQPIQRYKSK